MSNKPSSDADAIDLENHSLRTTALVKKSGDGGGKCPRHSWGKAREA